MEEGSHGTAGGVTGRAGGGLRWGQVQGSTAGLNLAAGQSGQGEGSGEGRGNGGGCKVATQVSQVRGDNHGSTERESSEITIRSKTRLNWFLHLT